MKQEGCLERWASNYDITADKACDDCCTEPKVKLQFRTLFDSISVNSDSVYLDDFNNTFKYVSAEFFISRFRGWNSEGDTIKNADTVSVLDDIYIDDFFFSPVKNSKDVGFIRDIEVLDTIEFYLGLSASMQDTSIITSDNLDLAAANDSLFIEDNRFSVFNTVLAIDTSQLDTIRYRSILTNSNEIKLVYAFGENGLNLSEGLDKTFQIDYFLDVALAGIDLSIFSVDAVGENLLNSLQQSVMVSVIE